MRILFGPKVWSTNLTLIKEAREYYKRGYLDYVEVFCVPGRASETAGFWADSGIPCVVHAPHSLSGLNFSLRDMEKENMKLAEEAFWFADVVKADTVIFHPGTRGRIEETLRQAEKIRDSRMIIENKPVKGLDGSTCVGCTPEELRRLCETLDLGFCLDFGHAVAAANSCNEDPVAFIDRFLLLQPKMYHLTDGDYSGELDRHDRYGSGSFPLKQFLCMVPDGCRVSDEASRSNKDSLGEYLEDRKMAEDLLTAGDA